MLVLAPAACCLAGVAVHEVLRVLMHAIRQDPEEEVSAALDPKKSSPPPKKGKGAVKVGLLHWSFDSDSTLAESSVG